MVKRTAGIHHITAIVGHPQENVDFYAGVLGLRLVKRTVNFDDPGTYHLYFGNEGGKPGAIITFFPWAGAFKGKIGDGQVGVTSYAIPPGSMGFWESRLEVFKVPFVKSSRFGEAILQFEDPHGLRLELVEREAGETNSWEFGGVTAETAIKGFAGATLFSSRPEQTAELLEKVMGLERHGAEGDFVRFVSPADIGNVVDVRMTSGEAGRMGVGMVHHIAWRAADSEEQLEWQRHIAAHGYDVTDVQDRNYFEAIYFREKGDILFEIATDPPGFAHDESHETMGSELMLPEKYEAYRERLNRRLTPFQVRELDGDLSSE